MKILHHFQNLNLTQDQQQALQKLSAFLDGPENIFMLKGYAGTGKTTLIRGVVKFLATKKQNFEVMAPTGRAAKILREKTGYGKTIHSAIYKLEDVEFSSIEVENKQRDEDYKLIFPLRELLEREMIFIIDEASMISSKESKHPILQFGSDILLRDILSYTKMHSLNSKIIFVGDPVQLPPVGDNKSWAFEPKLFQQKGFQVVETELREVKRQSQNLILENASLIRDKIKEETPTELILKYDTQSFIRLGIEEFTNRFVRENPEPEMKSGIIVAFSNTQCHHYNTSIREKYFPGKQSICSRDIIQINNNNYNTYPVAVFNGDFARVLEVDEQVTTLSAPVWSEHNGKKERKTISLDFRKIKVFLDDYTTEFECMILDSLLNSPNRDLTLDEMKALYINFIMRFEDEQKRRKAQGQDTIKRNSNEYKELLLNDPYLNALKVKYGYAVTCHKAQGGEWDKVFIDYSGRVSLRESPLRWCYTATTRAVNSCFVVNPPNFTKFSKFKIHPIQEISKISKEAFVFENIALSPYHQKTQHKCKSKLYWELMERLEDTDFKVKDVLSRDYQERYTVSYGDHIIILEGYHKSSGIFENGFTVVSADVSQEIKDKIEQLFNQSAEFNYSLIYTPTISILDQLYSIMQEYCKDLKIPITNIIEHPNYVRYYLQTESLSANIQFYYNKNGLLTSAFPNSYKCSEDMKLQALIDKLNQYVV